MQESRKIKAYFTMKKQSKHNKGYDRMDRIADQMHRFIAKLLREEFKDPRIGWVTVASVEVSRDLSFAKIYITVMEEDKIKSTLEILNKASGFFRSHLSQSMHVRLVPKPVFIYDESIARGARLLSLIEQNSVTGASHLLNSDTNKPDTDSTLNSSIEQSSDHDDNDHNPH